MSIVRRLSAIVAADWTGLTTSGALGAPVDLSIVRPWGQAPLNEIR